MERELVMSGIGGQGIQLAALVIARAAVAEGREVQLFGSYGGMMRGGNTEAAVVVGDAPVEAPPTVGTTWSAVLLHHEHSSGTVARLRTGSVVLVNTTVFEGELPAGFVVVEVAATALAAEAGNLMAASMVMAGAYSAVTGLVRLESLEAAVAESLPTYRTQHVELNVRALRSGFAAAPRDLVPAWPGVPA